MNNKFTIAALVLVCICTPLFAETLSDDVWKSLDRFEAHTLAMADQSFEKKRYREAVPKYDSFLAQFHRSRAVAYAVFKKGRSLHLDNKRIDAIRMYTEIMDYFPNDLPIASPALYHTGQAHWENGDVEKAMTSWLEMATDSDYKKHPLAAHAINSLADNLMKQGKVAEAIPYFRAVAVDFRHKNAAPAYAALDKVVHHYVRRAPNEAKLRAFYRDVGTFDRRPRHIRKDADMAMDQTYWRRVWERIWREGRYSFTKVQVRERKKFFKYWADVFEPRMTQWEEFQIHAANMRLQATGDTAAWFRRMDALYASENTENQSDRILRWMRMYLGHKKKVMDYCEKLDYAKLDLKRIRTLMDILAREKLADAVFARIYKRFTFEKMSNAEIRELAFIVYEKLGDIGLGSSLVMKMKLVKMSDDEKSGLHKTVSRFDPTLVKTICTNFDDKDRGKFELLEFYHGRKQGAKAEGKYSLNMAEVKKERMALANELVGHETYAKKSWWMKAEFLHWDRKFAEAIPCYRSADNPPNNTWAIVDCLVGQGKIDPAIRELTHIENFFKHQAPRAAFAKAKVYRQAGRTKDEIAALRRVLKKYENSNESCEAHVRLERLGVPHIGGGVDAT